MEDLFPGIPAVGLNSFYADTAVHCILQILQLYMDFNNISILQNVIPAGHYNLFVSLSP